MILDKNANNRLLLPAPVIPVLFCAVFRDAGIKKRGFLPAVYRPVKLFDFITNFAGEDFKINPGESFAGDEFTGTFITPEYRKYSVKRRRKPGESDTAYRKYLAKREKALAEISGPQLGEVAQAYARESGRELKDEGFRNNIPLFFSLISRI